ncbi:MAG: FISUMP domain-containing protein [Melioribacteraceae bacterium]
MKRYFYSLLILLSIFLFLIISGCKKDETPTAPQNHLPKIENLTANPTTVLISTETTLTCIATDEDGDNLTITWSSKRGTFSNGVVGIAVKWIAPSTAGKDTITATVNDGKQTLQGKLEIIVGTVSASPTLLTPINNATEVSLSPTLTWNTVTNAVSYTLQVSTSNSFNSFVYNTNGLTNTSQLISGLNIATIYYWRVNSTNIYGTSSWSNVFSFLTVTPPQAPTLLTPSYLAVNISLTPTLSWIAIGNAISYTLQVSISSSFSSFVYNQSGLINANQAISGLSIFTIYYWRVSATNSYGISSWSNYSSFTTISAPCPGNPTVSYEGKTYNTVQIGTQCWLKENLDVGTMIQGTQDQANNGITEKYCYDNNPNNCATYGGLYQWNEAMQYVTTLGTQSICPTGWHVPTYSEFQTLGTAVSNNSNALKAIGQGIGSGVGTNTSGFSTLLAGGRATSSNFFYSLGDYTYVWSSTEENTNYAWLMYLNSNNSNIIFYYGTMELGYSVRCLKD